jgi:predicted O-linked N-acetylglucosamine transferase (SPINDLY family)
VAHSIVDLLECHDRSRFAVHGVSFGPQPESPTRGRIARACDQFIDARALSDREVVQKLRDLEIDIAIDLSGFTQGNRAGIFAQRAAPVQVGYLGFSGTTGAPFIDYILADGVVIPPGHDRFYSEKAVRLPNAYLPGDRKRTMAERTPTRGECGLPAVGTVFCCFNNSFKITPSIFDIWMTVLKRVEGSVLWLSHDNDDAPANLQLQAQRRGVDPGRLVFARRLPRLDDHLARYRLVDLFLDTLPYNAHVTAADALWSGAPVLTCPGTTFVGRVAASLLHAAGLPELVARNPADYEDIACRLGANPRIVADLKVRLAANRSTQPLFQTARLCRDIERAFQKMYRRSQEGRAAEAFDVEPEGKISG